MKKIDNYIDDLFGNDKSPEIMELKEEIKGHLIDMANEFINDGLNEEEAYKKAIERFDDGAEMKQELHNIIKELSLSLDTYKSKINGTRRMLCFISIITFLISGLMWYYNNSLQKNRNDLGIAFNEEIRKLSEKYDMTNVDEYKLELERLLNEEKYSKIKAFRLHVADMEEGNTSLSSSGVKAKTVYEKELDDSDIPMYTSYWGYNGKDFLDKSGNIINPDIFSEYFFYEESKNLIGVSLLIGVFSLWGYFSIKV